ncbi:thioesterase family protein [Conexibacter sp. SYSU D00693]|uniref:thioesterase family protein n=1 Tax=Conexibacter sp. SYSU D00693 TaxID=2812560 RepID=UPI00196A9AEC|nr:thioesterase family protein [Conexibacter sp. SYSU D00693]
MGDHAFAAETAVGPGGAVTISDAWNAPTGPNGGYVAAIVLRAMQDAVGDPARSPRSLTCHFLRPPQPGPATLEVTVERAGRSVSTLTARLVQDGKPMVLAIAAFSLAFASPQTWQLDGPPDVPPPDALEPFRPRPEMPAVAHRFETRWALGGVPFSGAPDAVSGGWLRLAHDRQPLDAPLVTLLTDAWMPASFSRLSAPAMAPTIDLTVHFRAPLPLAGHGPDDHVLAIFRSRHVQDGFVEEDGELFAQDGRLIAMSRQLAILR